MEGSGGRDGVLAGRGVPVHLFRGGIRLVQHVDDDPDVVFPRRRHLGVPDRGGRDDVRSDAGGVPAGHVADHRRWHRAADPAERGRLRQVLRSVLRHEEDLCHGERHDRNSDHADGFGCRTAGQSNYSGSSPTSMPNTTTGNTATGAVPLPQSPAGAASMPVAAPGAGQPLDPKTKKTILISGIVIGALIVLGIVYGVLNSTVFSAKSVAQSYLTAIADGKYDKANDIADPQVGKDQLKLLSDTVAKADNATIANPHIDSVKTVEGVAKVNVTYSLNGKNVNDSLTINKDGSKFLLFPNWKISSPLLKTITVSVPNAVESLSVNGVDVTAKNAEKSDSGTWTLRVYPGSYKVSIGKSGYVTSGITMVRTNADSDAADLKIMPTAKLKEDLSKAVNAKLDECAKSTDYAPEGCPFGFDLYDEDYYRNFAWSISVYPKLSDIDLDYGTFSTRQGKAKCTYEEKNFDDSWESQDDSTHFTVNGSFSIRDGKLSVTIDDED